MSRETPLRFTGTTRARGYHDWFTLTTGDLLLCGPDDIYLSLYGAQHDGGLAPIMCRFTTPDDMRLLGQALLDIAASLEQGGRDEGVSSR